jgi:heme exporter protein D
MSAHIAPHFHAGGAGFFLFLFFVIAAVALILTWVSKAKDTQEKDK